MQSRDVTDINNSIYIHHTVFTINGQNQELPIANREITSSSPSPQASMLLYWHENQYDDRNFKIHGRTLFFAVALFSVVLVFALFTLYIQRSCLPRGSVNIHAEPPPLTPCVSGVLDSAAIRSLPVGLCRIESEEDERECCICLGGFEEGEKMKVLPPCRHCYHCECVDRWLRTESSCPLCRVESPFESTRSCHYQRNETENDGSLE